MMSRGLGERRARRVVRMSASALRYQAAPNRNKALRERIVSLAHRHRRCGAGMVYLKLRQAGEQGKSSACQALLCRCSASGKTTQA
ncbi:hypothetical protein KO116_03515 [Halomonas sp. KO116]|nr:hypothetical protein KO116_03515 [Halomonas sp. KO116]